MLQNRMLEYGRVNPKSDFYMLSYGMYTYITDLHYI